MLTVESIKDNTHHSLPRQCPGSIPGRLERGAHTSAGTPQPHSRIVLTKVEESRKNIDDLATVCQVPLKVCEHPPCAGILLLKIFKGGSLGGPVV